MERYIAIKESFFWKWRQKENSKYFLLMASLIYDASYKDTEKLRKGCLEYVAKKFAKSIGVAEKILASKINYLKDVGEVKIIKEGERRILEVVYYDYYVITPNAQNTNKETTCEDSDGKNYHREWEKLPSGMVKTTIGDGKNYHRIHYYNNTKKDGEEKEKEKENFTTTEIKMNLQDDKDNKNEKPLTENRENMEEYWKQFGNANNPTWETFSGTLPCGRQVYNLSGEYVCYMKTYVEQGYTKAVDLFLRRYWYSDYKKAFAQNSNIPINQIDKWIIEFRNKQNTFPKQETFLKNDIKGTGERFYTEMFGYLINYLNKKAEAYKKEIANKVLIRDNREELRKAGIDI